MISKGLFTKRDRRPTYVFALIAIFIAGLIIAVVSLLPGNSPELGESSKNGAARDFMFPFVFTDEDKNLYVVKDIENISTIDSDAVECVHDYQRGKVYYIRDNVLYEYNINTNQRRELTDNILKYKIFSDFSAVICIDQNNTVKLLKFSDLSTVALNAWFQSINMMETVVMGDSCALYIDNYVEEADTADLFVTDSKGKTNLIGTGITVSKGYHINQEDKIICYYKNNNLYFSDKKGNILNEFPDSEMIISTKQNKYMNPCTEIEKLSDCVKFQYIKSDIKETNSGNLLYWNGENTSLIAENVFDVIYYSDKDNTIIYTAGGSASENSFTVPYDVYTSRKGTIPVKILTSSEALSFLYLQNKTVLYYKNKESFVYRVNINDVNLEIFKVAEKCEELLEYGNKSFVMYDNYNDNDMRIVLKDDTEDIIVGGTIRLYGKLDDVYLLQRTNSQGDISYDIVEGIYLNRVCNSVSSDIFFDKYFDYIIYVSEGSLYVFHDNVSKEICSVNSIEAIPFAG